MAFNDRKSEVSRLIPSVSIERTVLDFLLLSTDAQSRQPNKTLISALGRPTREHFALICAIESVNQNFFVIRYICDTYVKKFALFDCPLNAEQTPMVNSETVRALD